MASGSAALVKFITPLTFCNVVSNDLTIRKAVVDPSTGKQLLQLTIPTAHYRKGDITEMVNKFITDTEVKIIINKHTRNATVATGHQVLFMSQALYDFFRA